MKTMKVHLSMLAMLIVATMFAQGTKTIDPLSIKDELGLTSDQVKRIETVHRNFAKQRETISRDKTMPAEEKREVMVEKRREERRKVGEVLTKEQREKAGEILKERFPREERVGTPRIPAPERKPLPEGKERPMPKPAPVPQRIPDADDDDDDRDDHHCCPANHGHGKKKGHYKNRNNPGHSKHGHHGGKGCN